MRRLQNDKLFKVLILAFFMLGLGITSTWAIGTQAGTTISNQATLSYRSSVTGVTTTKSNSTSTRVDELIAVDVTWQDGAPVSVSPGATNQVLTFRVTNTGNGQEQFGLTPDPTLIGDDFDPTAVQLYLDDGDGIFSASHDTLYTSINKPGLIPDQAITVFIVSNIPAGLTNGLTGQVSLTATSVTFDGVTATALPSFGDMGTTAVRFPDGSEDTDTGAYLTEQQTPDSADLSLEKSVSVTGPGAVTEPVPGAILTYRIDVHLTNTNSAEDVVISDPIPTFTTYRADSLRLNGSLLTDASDGDPGTFNSSGNGTVSVNLGDLNEISPVQTITFEVKINP